MNPDQLFISSRNNVSDSRLSTPIPMEVHQLYSSSTAPFVNSGVDLLGLTETNLGVSTCSPGDKQLYFYTALKISDVITTYL